MPAPRGAVTGDPCDACCAGIGADARAGGRDADSGADLAIDGRPCASTIAFNSSADTPNRIRDSPNSPISAISGTARFHQLNDSCLSPLPVVFSVVEPESSGTLIAAPPSPRTWYAVSAVPVAPL